MMEAPHLSKLMEKIKSPLQARNQHLVHASQVTQAAQTTINN